MSVSQRSRYLAAPQVTVDATSDALPLRGNNITIYTPVVLFQDAKYRRYQVVQGDTYQLLADRFLGTAFDWWRIADMNPQIFWPDQLVPGTVIRLPV